MVFCVYTSPEGNTYTSPVSPLAVAIQRNVSKIHTERNQTLSHATLPVDEREAWEPYLNIKNPTGNNGSVYKKFIKIIIMAQFNTAAGAGYDILTNEKPTSTGYIHQTRLVRTNGSGARYRCKKDFCHLIKKQKRKELNPTCPLLKL
ncbi:hypothetical protein NDU88_007756 [Pleurodeles waltl]|uniref:Uncharacterized protein n=1 Tax=Pleurodeles waltl TaxID=8319 RepID=A0AAV7PQW9_PLEWA|nr:hypothetical protein NDU88_007756 [Pleurodeles waltl]